MSGLDLAGFLVLGFVAGAYGTLVGIGGGLLVVPVLIFAHYPPKDAAGTSMVVVLANAASGSVSYLRQGRVHVRAAFVFALAGIPGALLGGLVDQFVPRRLFSLLFGLLLSIVAVRIFVSRGTVVNGNGTDAPTAITSAFSVPIAAIVGLLAGFVASVFGVGGGLIFVPTMVYVFGFLPHVATATSTFIIALTAIFGTASHAHYHDIRWEPALAIAGGAIVGAQLGSRIAPRVHHSQLLRLFAIAAFLAALWLFHRVLR